MTHVVQPEPAVYDMGRFAAGPKLEIVVPSRGQNSGIDARYVDPPFSSLLQNIVLDTPGQVTKRGGSHLAGCRRNVGPLHGHGRSHRRLAHALERRFGGACRCA